MIEGFLKIAFGRPLLSEPLFAGRTTVARSEEFFNLQKRAEASSVRLPPSG